MCVLTLQVIHLKRFDYVNSKWVKTQKVVNFPFKNFDPTAYLASVPQETILRHKQLLEKRMNFQNELESSLESSFDTRIVEENGSDTVDDAESTEKLVDIEESEKRMRRRSTGKVRQRLESTSLTKTPINDKDLKDYHQHKLLKGQDPFDLKYQLYAVVVSFVITLFSNVEISISEPFRFAERWPLHFLRLQS